MQEGTIKIYSGNQPYQISIAKALLENEDIVCFEIDKKDSSYVFGEIELYVLESMADRALLILTENDLL